MRSGSSSQRRANWEARLLRERASLLFGLNLVLAIAVGYLIEKAVTGNWDAGSTCLLAVGAAAGVGGILLWAAGHWFGARRGALLNVCAGPSKFQSRRRAEAATLAAWSTDRYPSATLMPWIRHEGGDDFAWAVADQVAASLALVPAARGVSILAAGKPDLLVVAGARLQPLLGERIHLIADVIDDSSNEPFLEFGLPARTPRQPDTSRAPAERSASGHLLALLRHREPGASLPPTSTGPIATGDVVWIGTPAGQGEYAGHIDETANAYQEVLAALQERLDSLGGAGTVDLVTDGPAVLAFGAGVLARRQGWQARSAPWDAERGYLQFTGAGSDLVDPGRPAGTKPGRPTAGKRALQTAWWAALAANSLARGVGIPLATGSLAMLTEWFVARSGQGPGAQGLLGRTSDQWTFGVFAFLLGAALSLLGWWVSTRFLTRPEFVIDISKVFPTPIAGSLGRREIRLWRELAQPDVQGAQSAAHAHADWVKARLVEILTTYPASEHIILRIPELGLGPRGEQYSALRHEVTKLTVTKIGQGFRGNQPVVIECGSDRERLIPDRTREWLDRKDAELPNQSPGMAAARAGLLRKLGTDPGKAPSPTNPG